MIGASPDEQVHAPSEPRGTRALRLAFGGLSVLLLVVGALGLWLAAADRRWVTIGFDALLIPAAVFGLLIGLGRFRDGLGLAMLCVAGTAATAGVLSEPTVVNFLKGQRPTAIVQGIDLVTLTLAKLALAAPMALLAGLVVLIRRPAASARRAGLAIANAAPAAAITAAWGVRGIRQSLAGVHPALTTILVLMSFVLFTAFVSAAVHFAIRAFEAGRDEDEPAGAPA